MYEMSSGSKTEAGSRAKAEAAAKRAAEKAERTALRAQEKAEAAASRAVEKTRRVEERAAEKAGRAEARAAEKAEQAEERAGAAAARATEVGERAAAAATRAAERAEEAGAKSGTRAHGEGEGEPLIWMREEPSSRRPTLTRAEIARAALEISDTEGFDAVSMRRVAQRLGAGTMTLYHYVRNKDELVTLMSDLAMGEILVPEGELSTDWRAALTQIAHRTRSAFAAHHWIFSLTGDAAPGPNGMRHFEQSLQAIDSLELMPEEVFDLIGQLDDYVFGFALRELQEQEEHLSGWPAEVRDFFQREIDSGDYPRVEAILGDDADAGIARIMDLLSDDGRFDRGLARLLDGIEANLPK